MKPICTKCQRFYRPLKNGVGFLEMMPIDGHYPTPKPGTEEPDKWKPYKLWQADLWVCKGCGTEIIVGAGSQPIAEHYQPNFEVKCRLYPPIVKINDC